MPLNPNSGMSDNLGIYYLVYLNVLVCVLYSPFIQEIGVLHILSALLTTIMTFLFVIRVALTSRIGIYHAILILSLFYYVFIAALNVFGGISVNEVIRAYISFIYLPVFAALVSLLDEKELKSILKLLFLISFISALLVFPFFVELALGMLNYSRYTAHLGIIHTPILLIGIPLSYYLKINRISITSVFLIAIFATQSKGQILIGLAGLAVCVLSKVDSKLFKVSFIAAFILFFSGVLFLFQDTLLKRFTDISGSTSMHRVQEIVIAFNYFYKNPVLGAGPTAKFSIENEGTESDEQNYVHNVIMYLLALSGFVGLMIYLTPYVISLRASVSDENAYLIKIAIVSSFLYLLIAATFKSIQTNIFIGVLLGACFKVNQLKNRQLIEKKA